MAPSVPILLFVILTFLNLSKATFTYGPHSETASQYGLPPHPEIMHQYPSGHEIPRAQLIGGQPKAAPIHEGLPSNLIISPSAARDTMIIRKSDQYKPLNQSQIVREVKAKFSEELNGYSGLEIDLIGGIICSGKYCDEKQFVVFRDGNSHPVRYVHGQESGFIGKGNTQDVSCNDNGVVNQMWCKGKYCDELKIGCGTLGKGYKADATDFKYTAFYSEEQGGEGLCPESYYLNGISCHGSYCDNIQLKCIRVYYIPPERGARICQVLRRPWYFLTTGAWFSEEHGGMSEMTGQPLEGILCRGKYCDNKKLYSLQTNLNPVVGTKHEYWTQWFTDGSSNFASCNDGYLVNQVQCRGSYCDDMRLHCAALNPEFEDYPETSHFVPWVSEENVEAHCPPGFLVKGMKCEGSYCDKISLQCVLIQCS